jgi:hypothetical protein
VQIVQIIDDMSFRCKLLQIVDDIINWCCFPPLASFAQAAQ